MQACSVAEVAPPRHLPMMIAAFEIGATSISRRKPNSRSQTSEMPANTAMNSTDIASTPGNRNVLKSTSSLVETTLPRPVPITKRNSSGCSSIATMRARSWVKRMISRRQTTDVARSSWRRPPSASSTLGATTRCVGSRGSSWEACWS